MAQREAGVETAGVVIAHVVAQRIWKSGGEEYVAVAMAVAVGAAAEAEAKLVVGTEGSVVAQREVDGVAVVVVVVGAVVGLKEESRGVALGQGDKALALVVIGAEQIVPRSAEGDVVPLTAGQATLDVEIGKAVDAVVSAVGGVEVAVVGGVGQVVPLLVAVAIAVVVAPLQHVPRHEVEVGDGVNLVANVDIVVPIIARPLGVAAVGALAGGVVAGGEGVAAAAVVNKMAVATGQVEGKLQAIGVAHVAEPRRVVGARVAAEAQEPELACAQAGRGDDVEYVVSFGHHVFGRGVLDDLHAGQCLGGHALEKSLQRGAVHTGGTAVEPHVDVVGAAHGEVPFQVDLHRGCIADSIPGGEARHRLVVLDVVVDHLAGHAVDGFGGGNADFLQLHELHLGVDTVQFGLARTVGSLCKQA